MGYCQAKQYSQVGVPAGAEREETTENLFKEITVENVPNLGRDMTTQVHKTQRYPRRFYLKRSLLRYIIIKLSKIEDKENFESSKKKIYPPNTREPQ